MPGYDYRDTAQHKRIVERAYAGSGWIVPELIERVRDAADLYFDAVSRVRLDTWSRGRIGLLGDAASSSSLFGEGTSLPMAGAYRLVMVPATRLGVTLRDNGARLVTGWQRLKAGAR